MRSTAATVSLPQIVSAYGTCLLAGIHEPICKTGGAVCMPAVGQNGSSWRIIANGTRARYSVYLVLEHHSIAEGRRVDGTGIPSKAYLLTGGQHFGLVGRHSHPLASVI